jgi:hypothetical protein
MTNILYSDSGGLALDLLEGHGLLSGQGRHGRGFPGLGLSQNFGAEEARKTDLLLLLRRRQHVSARLRGLLLDDPAPNPALLLTEVLLLLEKHQVLRVDQSRLPGLMLHGRNLGTML